MKIQGWVIFCFFLLGCSLLRPLHAQEKTDSSEERFKSISVLNAMPADQMGKVMNLMSASLGVNCGHCHDGNDFAKEGNPHKDVARQMISMTLQLNREHFQGRVSVTCYTCHQGTTKPSPRLTQEFDSRKAAQPASPPSVTSVLARFQESVGGTAKLQSIKTRHLIAKRLEPDGRFESEEVWHNADGTMRVETNYGSVTVIEGFDGSTAWKKAKTPIAIKPDEQEQIQREAQFAFGLQIESAYSLLTYREVVRKNDRDLFQLEGTSLKGMKEYLYFDVESGLLVRRTAELPTYLGPFLYEVDYRDYREFDGVKLPTTIRFAIPNIEWTRKVDRVEHTFAGR